MCWISYIMSKLDRFIRSIYLYLIRSFPTWMLICLYIYSFINMFKIIFPLWPRICTCRVGCHTSTRYTHSLVVSVVNLNWLAFFYKSPSPPRIVQFWWAFMTTCKPASLCTVYLSAFFCFDSSPNIRFLIFLSHSFQEAAIQWVLCTNHVWNVLKVFCFLFYILPGLVPTQWN